MDTQRITKNQWIGIPEQPPQRICLQAGELQVTMLDGRLLNVCFHGEKLIDEVYFALRDPNWGTVPYTLKEQKIEKHPDRFVYHFQAEHTVGNYQYRWQGCVKGSADGTVTFSSTGEAGERFLKNRLGFCVLHPISCAGLPCLIEHSNGTSKETVFPKQIAPHQPFFDISAMTYRRDEFSCRVAFEGDVFECEDQRNWTDASFKTYCTPLYLPFPVQVDKGERFSQTVHINCTASGISDVGKPTGEDKDNIIEYSELLPINENFSLGTCLRFPIDEASLKIGKELGLNHIRVELHFCEQPVFFDELLKQAAQMTNSIHLFVFLTINWQQEMPLLLNLLARHPVVTAVILYQEGRKVIDKTILSICRGMLLSFRLPVGSGTDAYFTQLNREPLPGELMDFLCYSNNPQVHAFDNHSIMQTTAGQAANVISARALYPDKSVYVTPVTLKIRWNPDATAEVSDHEQLLLNQIDNRQMSLMCASWMLRSIIALSLSGAAGADYFELAGPRGFFAEQNRILPEEFPTFSGMVFPSYYVFREALVIFREQNVKAINGQQFCILLSDNKILIANTTDEQIKLSLDGWPSIEGICLNGDTAERYAICKKEQMTEDIKMIFNSAAGNSIILQPYSIILGNFI
ncbi:MAG: hypothetical protein GX897_09295 [Clostridiales bacterium]|nr:hypothetical protein [Clostridiales bacterium]